MGFLWFGKAKTSSTSGGADIEPPASSAAVNAAHQVYREYAGKLVDESSEEFTNQTTLVVSTLDAKSLLRQRVGQLRIQARSLENQLALARACGGPTAALQTQLTAVRTDLGRAEQQLNAIKAGLEAEKMALQMAKEELHRNHPRRHGRDKWR